MPDPLQPWLDRWNLRADGAPICTRSSSLLPVRHAGGPAMLKVAHEPEERSGAQLMRWWDGEGAAQVLETQDDALLLERATGSRSLAEFARGGRDDEACRILCGSAAKLHAPRRMPPPDPVPLERWFAAIEPGAERYGGLVTRAAETARDLFAESREPTVLHGDLHHDNVLDFGARGWLAIDPKGLVGDRTFEFANLFRNPDRATAMAEGRFAHRLDVVCEAADLDRRRLLRWILAFAGLSSVWRREDGESADDDLAIAARAASELYRP